MFRIIWTAFIFLGLGACVSTTATRLPERPAIVLKLDDFRADQGVHPGWRQTFEFLNANAVTASVGVIGEGLESPQADGVQWLRAQHALGHELWNHGYCHCRSGEGDAQIREFRGTALADQQFALNRTQQLGEERLGITFTSFGAPYNSTDSATATAMADVPALGIWMFKDTSEEAATTSAQVLPRIAAVNIEYPVHIPDFEAFHAGYLAHQDATALIIQGHPQSWVEDPQRFEEFQRIIRFLIAQDTQFVTPSQAASMLE